LKSGVTSQLSSNEKVIDSAVMMNSVVASENPLDNVIKPQSASLEISDVLCFVRNKYGNYPVSTIKSTMCGFFRDDEFMSAKGTLLQAVGGKGLNVQQYSKKRIGENKNKANVDDILGIWQAVDEGGLVDQLPAYSCYYKNSSYRR